MHMADALRWVVYINVWIAEMEMVAGYGIWVVYSNLRLWRKGRR